MSKPILIVLFISTAIIFLMIGGAAVFFYTKPTPEEMINQVTGSLISSKAVSSMTASGKVTSINEKYITLENQGDSVVVLISQNALIYSMSGGEKNKVAFENIKIEDSLNVGLKLMSNGKLEGQSVIIFDKAE